MSDGLARLRTATLLGSVLAALCSGTNYVYSAYAPQLGDRLHITSTQLNIIGELGVYTSGPVLGRIVDRRGPRPLLIACFFLLLIGYMGIRSYYDAGLAGSDNKLPFLNLVALSIFSFMTGVGGNCGLIAGTNATAKSFPERLRATTVGFVLSGFGLSAFLFSSLSHLFFPGDTSSFLLFLSLGTSIPIIVSFLTVQTVPHAELPDTLGTTRSVLPSNVAISTSNLLEQDTLGEHINGHVYVADGVSLYPEVLSAVDHPRSVSRGADSEFSPTRVGMARRSASRRPQDRSDPLILPDPIDVYGKKLLTGWEFFLLFAILSLLSGTGLMYINNVGSIAQALSAKGDPDYNKIEAGKLQAAQVSIISLANCGARIAIGASADFFKGRFGAHRSYLLVVISAMLMLSQIVASHNENTENLWQTSLMLGLGYGGIFGLLPTITIEWFGIAHYSENWGFVSLAPLFGGNIFSILFGRDFDRHASNLASETAVVPSLPNTPRAPLPEPGRVCLDGRACYADTLTITTIACMVALLLSLVAGWRDWKKGKTSKYESLPQEILWEDAEE
ncbi:major facilitator superfamily domain-containing protein [Hysterangium stoloniferum]|nr:major facilitator superfamily domain-containing protein [Hysterangium stoloniferum]